MNPYEDILSLPHHRSAKRSHMPRPDRAAQFAPFAALSGYEAEIAEAGRLTESWPELLEGKLEQINEALCIVKRELHRQPWITVTFFVPDQRKSGGAYHTVTGRVRKLMEHEGILVLMDDTRIPIERIWEMTVR